LATTVTGDPMHGTPLVLADVEMGVTAELGRCHMTVRELLSLTPGAIIDLDRAAGALVDVLVNGTLIARGEVVVIDEEFGIRISELLNDG
jgi:flagellar motor switch protein FliN/FliY